MDHPVKQRKGLSHLTFIMNVERETEAELERKIAHHIELL